MNPANCQWTLLLIFIMFTESEFISVHWTLYNVQYLNHVPYPTCMLTLYPTFVFCMPPKTSILCPVLYPYHEASMMSSVRIFRIILNILYTQYSVLHLILIYCIKKTVSSILYYITLILSSSTVLNIKVLSQKKLCSTCKDLQIFVKFWETILVSLVVEGDCV